MPTRQLSAAEENEARKAFAMLQDKKLLTVNKRGRPASMAPVHAALAIRKGAFAKNRGASRGAESQLTAAAMAYGGVPAKKIKEYLDLLAQCDAPESGARLLQTPLAARERLRRRAARVGLELADVPADGNAALGNAALGHPEGNAALGKRGSLPELTLCVGAMVVYKVNSWTSRAVVHGLLCRVVEIVYRPGERPLGDRRARHRRTVATRDLCGRVGLQGPFV